MANRVLCCPTLIIAMNSMISTVFGDRRERCRVRYAAFRVSGEKKQETRSIDLRCFLELAELDSPWPSEIADNNRAQGMTLSKA